MSFENSFGTYCKEVVHDAFSKSLFTKWQIVKLYFTYLFLPYILLLLPFKYVYKLNLYIIFNCISLSPFVYITVYVYINAIDKCNDYFILFLKKEIFYLFLFLFVISLLSHVFRTEAYILRKEYFSISYLAKCTLFTASLALFTVVALKKYLHSEYKKINFYYLFLFSFVICGFYLCIEKFRFFLGRHLFITGEASMHDSGLIAYNYLVGHVTFCIYFVAYLFLIKMFIIAAIKQNDLNVASFEKESC